MKQLRRVRFDNMFMCAIIKGATSVVNNSANHYYVLSMFTQTHMFEQS